MTGSGKSTTVASLIDWINTNRALHILTIEAPVEFVHGNKNSIISQRNVGTDTPTAIEAVHGALRHDPDVLFIGEMRDSDTIRAAIDAASTGHLVISTFHANNAAEVPNRIVSFFDPAERDLVRLQLRDALRCVISQRSAAAFPRWSSCSRTRSTLTSASSTATRRPCGLRCSRRRPNRARSSKACWPC
jgi:twitching motility protein PilT